MTQSTRERAARALYERMARGVTRSPKQGRRQKKPWESLHPGVRAIYLADVDAVLDEIREPGAAALVPLRYASYACNEYGADDSAETWREAIDAIKRGEG